ncbi:carbohydrate porin [Vibrio navarrensis]|uniref:carbohydrate porin n=1 Tax=Vibrio navarrensis TaxID=29495 RepID=UPI00186A4AAE|nr:carbohydrate porin [Vibrio navarrensis]
MYDASASGRDVEFNLDYTDKNATNKQELNQNGRILVQVAAEHTVSGDRYIKMQAQPLLDTSGNVNLDDAWFAMGKKADWELKVGRFEAYDLFPVGQDTMLAYATANEPYRANAARGRGDNGQVAFSKTFDSVYFEVASLFKDESNADNNAVFLRPVVAFQATDSFRVAGGLEANVTADKLDPANDFMGYGVTANYSADAVSVNLNYAFRDFDSQTKEQSTIGANLLVSGFGLGHVYAQDETNAVKSKLNTTYASYEIANVWDVDALNIYLGTYYSKQSDSDNKDLGARIRFKYFF